MHMHLFLFHENSTHFCIHYFSVNFAEILLHVVLFLQSLVSFFFDSVVIQTLKRREADNKH